MTEEKARYDINARRRKNILEKARSGTNPPLIWKPRRVKVRLFQDETGQWMVVLGRNGNPMLATDAEVALWLELQELKAERREHHGR